MKNTNNKYKVAKESKRYYDYFALYPEYFETIEAAIENAKKRSAMQECKYAVMYYADSNELLQIAIYENGHVNEAIHGWFVKHHVDMSILF